MLSLKNVHDKFKVTYDGKGGTSVFTIHKPNGQVIDFTMYPNHLHYHHTGNHQLSMVNTMKQNEKGYSKRQIQATKATRTLQSAVGFPSTANLKAIIAFNQVVNCPVTVDDVEHTEKIYGPSIPFLKGKNMYQAPIPVISNYITVPPKILIKNHDVILAGDIFFVNQVLFLATISENIKLTTAQYLKDHKASTILSVISKVQALYTKRGFVIRQTLIDRESKPPQDDLNHMQINLNTTATDEHVSLIEWQIRVIKE